MLKNKLTTRYVLFLMAGILLLFMQSCSNEEVIQPTESNLSNEMIQFKNHEDYKSSLANILSMNLDELTAYEEAKGYKSFGRASEELYLSVNPENFKSLEEVKAFVSSNSNYLKLIEDEEGELFMEPVLSNSPDRYFLNQDKMFQIKDNVYKVYEKSIAMTSATNLELLKSLDAQSLLSLNSKAVRIMPLDVQALSSTSQRVQDAAHNCGTSAVGRATNKRDRTKIEIAMGYLDTYDINNVPMTIFQNRVLIRPYKKTLGVWYWCSRTLSCNIKIATDYETTSGWKRGFFYKSESGKSASKLEYILDGGVISIGAWARYNIHYGGYDCWADSPSTSPANIECHTELF